MSHNSWSGGTRRRQTLRKHRVTVFAGRTFIYLFRILIRSNLMKLCHLTLAACLAAAVLLNSSAAAQSTPPPGYNWIQNPANGHYYALTTSMSWTGAAAEADALGTSTEMATIRNQAEQDWIHVTFPSPPWIWIGLTDQAIEGTWVWRSGEPVAFTAWHSGEPNNLGNEDYGHLKDAQRLWNDLADNGGPFPALLEWTGAPAGPAATERVSLRSTGACSV